MDELRALLTDLQAQEAAGPRPRAEAPAAGLGPEAVASGPAAAAGAAATGPGAQQDLHPVFSYGCVLYDVAGK
eukprot:3477075-Alexandrium_andersonii.AAC.1